MILRFSEFASRGLFKVYLTLYESPAKKLKKRLKKLLVRSRVIECSSQIF